MTDENIKLSKDQKEILAEGFEAIEVVQNTIGDFLNAANVDAVYGPPIKDGETLIVPTAEVVAVMGFGVGSGYGSGMSEPTEGDESEAETGEGGGGGPAGVQGGRGGRRGHPGASAGRGPDRVRAPPRLGGGR